MSPDDLIAIQQGSSVTERASGHAQFADFCGMPRDRMSAKTDPSGSTAP